MVGESLFFTLSGCFVGIFLTYPISKIVGQMLEIYFPVFKVPFVIIPLNLLVSIVAGILATIIPIYQVVKMKISEALRNIG